MVFVAQNEYAQNGQKQTALGSALGTECWVITPRMGKSVINI